MIYLDNAATTRPLPAAAAAFSECVENFGNPSSLHSVGVNASSALSAARKAVAASIKCDPSEIYFTSGASESNNTAIFGAAKKFGKRKKTIVVSAVEHPSVAAPLAQLETEGFNVVRIMPKNGVFAAEDFADAIDDDTFLVSCMYCNNELGTLLPVEKIFKAAHKKNPHLLTHCDLVQGYLKFPVKVKNLGADLISVSAHKVHGFKGIGALYIRQGVTIPPLILGGGQERGFRSGTESLPLITAFGSAVSQLAPTVSERCDQVSRLAARLADGLAKISGAHLNSPADGSPYVVNFSMTGIRSEILLHWLEKRDIYVSSGSACSKGKKSSVLAAYGISDVLADSAIRVSFCGENTLADVDALLAALADARDELLTAN